MNPSSKSLISEQIAHTDRIWLISWNNQGTLLASCSGDKSIKIWTFDPDFKKFTLINTLKEEHIKTIRTISWSNDDKFLACGSFDSTISIYLVNEGKFDCVSKLEAHENEIKSVSWDYTNTYLASCSRDKTIMIWEYEKQDNLYEFSCVSVLNGHDQDVKFVKWKPNTSILFSGSYDETIKVWEQEEDDWICIQTLKGHTSTVWCLDFTNDGNFMVSVSEDCTIKIWDLRSKNYVNNNIINLCTLTGYHNRSIYTCAFNKDGDILATGGGDNKFNLFKKINGIDNMISFELFDQNEEAHENDINCVIFHPKFDLLTTCSDDYKIKIWKISEI